MSRSSPARRSLRRATMTAAFQTRLHRAPVAHVVTGKQLGVRFPVATVWVGRGGGGGGGGGLTWTSAPVRQATLVVFAPQIHELCPHVMHGFKVATRVGAAVRSLARHLRTRVRS